MYAGSDPFSLSAGLQYGYVCLETVPRDFGVRIRMHYSAALNSVNSGSTCAHFQISLYKKNDKRQQRRLNVFNKMMRNENVVFLHIFLGKIYGKDLNIVNRLLQAILLP